MDKETAQYIVNYFSSFLTEQEKMAIRHTHSLFKIENRDGSSSNTQVEQMYKKVGWLTEDESVLNLLKDGYDAFEIKVANRILKEYPDEIFINNCPQCNKLARTPYAKQCRHCSYDWHNKTGVLARKLKDLTVSAIQLGKVNTWNEIPVNCKYILSEIRSELDFSDFHEERIYYKKENLKKKPCDLDKIVSALISFYENIYDINMQIFKVEKGLTIIDIRYFLKTSVDKDYYEVIKNEAPMFHAKLPIPPYIVDSKNEKFDINWQFNEIKYRWNMFKARKRLIKKNK